MIEQLGAVTLREQLRPQRGSSSRWARTTVAITAIQLGTVGGIGAACGLQTAGRPLHPAEQEPVVSYRLAGVRIPPDRK
jgi:hypothetical protein